jgi:uncharacterized protein YbjT (DUF2867 family)
MSSQTLVFAAGGRVASRVIAALCARGERPIAAVRNPEKARATLLDEKGLPLPIDIVTVDSDDTSSFCVALTGVDVAFLALGSSPEQVAVEKRFIDAAASTDLPHLVKLSSGLCSPDSPSVVLQWHAEIEDHLRTSGVPHTLVSPATFMDLLMLSAASISAHHRWAGTAPIGRNALIDSDDVVDAVVAVLTKQAFRGETHVLTGPEAMSWLEVATVLSAVLDYEVTYDAISVEARRAQLEELGFATWRVNLLLGLDALNRDGIYATTTDTVERLTGHPARTLSRFVEQHREAFRQRS